MTHDTAYLMKDTLYSSALTTDLMTALGWLIFLFNLFSSNYDIQGCPEKLLFKQ